MKQNIEPLIQQALNHLKDSGQLSVDMPNIQIDATKDKQFGDFASNIALILAKSAQRKPREIAEMIKSAMPSSPYISKTEIAGPGFINFFLTNDAFYQVIADVLHKGEQYGRSDYGKNKKIILEFVSSNPTGPLHVGHGRHASFGAAIADLLDAVGFNVHREYYVNDGGRQMDILAVSVWLRYLELNGETLLFPTNGYQGEYVVEIARQLDEQYHNKFHFASDLVFQKLPLDEPQGGDKELYIDAIIIRAKELLGEINYELVFDYSLKIILEDIKSDLADFGVHFQNWFSEREFTKTDVVDRTLDMLKQSGHVYEREGALWFRSTDFNDEKDRVLERSNGQRTYFANDLVYHINKFERGFDFSIDIFGSDHHGYIPRMKAGLQASKIAPEKLTYLLVQFVNLYRSGTQVAMSTRSGSFVTLRELRKEVGNDAARFFYVIRKSEQPMDFDLDLAKAQSNENPVYYIQYAYARICSVFRQLSEKNLQYNQDEGLQNVNLLTHEHELQLLNTISRFSDVLLGAAKLYEPQILTSYLRELANDFHSYYNSQQFLVEDDALRNARLTLNLAARQVIANGLKLLGVSTPNTM